MNLRAVVPRSPRTPRPTDGHDSLQKMLFGGKEDEGAEPFRPPAQSGSFSSAFLLPASLSLSLTTPPQPQPPPTISHLQCMSEHQLYRHHHLPTLSYPDPLYSPTLSSISLEGTSNSQSAAASVWSAALWPVGVGRSVGYLWSE